MMRFIQLPSGKIVDLYKCIAIIPDRKSEDNKVILADTEYHMYIDAADLEALRAEIFKPSSNRV
jgi:hypothetical protein